MMPYYIMSEISEPIICQVNIPDSFNTPLYDKDIIHKGRRIFEVKRANKIKGILFESISYKRIELPYRFSLISCEIIYEKRHIKSIRLSGFHLSGIDIPSGLPQLSSWSTDPAPKTSLDFLDNNLLNKENFGETYFVAHRFQEDFYIYWSLEENYDIPQNPHKYPGGKWVIID